jgi:hypothetical protein
MLEVSKGRKEKAKGCRHEAYEAPKKHNLGVKGDNH